MQAIKFLRICWCVFLRTFFLFWRDESTSNFLKVFLNTLYIWQKQFFLFINPVDYKIYSQLAAHCMFIITSTDVRRLSFRNILVLSGSFFPSIDSVTYYIVWKLKNRPFELHIIESISGNRSLIKSYYFCISFYFPKKY